MLVDADVFVDVPVAEFVATKFDVTFAVGNVTDFFVAPVMCPNLSLLIAVTTSNVPEALPPFVKDNTDPVNGAP